MNRHQRSRIASLGLKLDDIRQELDMLAEEEQEKIYNLPEGLECSDLAQSLEDAQMELEDLSNNVDDIKGRLDELANG